MATPDSTRPRSLPGAALALTLLTALNFVNYIDRYILPGVQEQIKGEFALSDSQLGSLTFWFMVAYIAASPITGWLGDRFPRKPMIVCAALFWSGINFFTASVHSYMSLNIRHAALGIGEASFGVFAPAILADFYPEGQRNRVLTIFNIAVPVGAALGYLVGGVVAEHFGWRMSFVVSAVPGVLLALAIAFWMREPERGAGQHERSNLERGAVMSLLRNPAYMASILGYAAVTFSLGGISWWMPSFLHRAGGMSLSQAAFEMGAVTVVTGLAGTAFGGWVAQRWMRRDARALYFIPALGAALAILPGVVCFFGPRPLMIPALALAIFLIFLGNGPVNAASINAVSPKIRATALAGQLLAIHLLGDAISPKVIGIVSDHTTLAVGLGSTLIAMVVAAIIFTVGARYAPAIQADQI